MVGVPLRPRRGFRMSGRPRDTLLSEQSVLADRSRKRGILTSMNIPEGLRIGLYGRKSAKDDAGTDAESIHVQYQHGEAWAEQHQGIVVARWADNISAWNGSERPNFLRALEAVERGDIELLWVYGSDRFSREGARRILAIMDRPLHVRPKIFFAYESLCTWEESHRFPLVVKAEVDKQFADRLSKNIRDAKAHSRERGVWSARPPYGTRRSLADPRKLEPNPDTWPTIVRIYTEAAAGHSLRGIAMRLNADGIPSPNGAGWANATIRGVLHNPVYEGWMFRRVAAFPVLYLDSHGKPVRVFADDAETLPADLVTRARAANPHGPVNDGSRDHKSPLRGILYCYGCGSRMQRSGGPQNRHYRCFRLASGQGCPEATSVLERSILPFVETTWANIVASLDVGDDADHATLATIGARWYAEATPAEDTQAAREAVKLARRQLARLREDRELGLWDDDLAEYAARVKAAQRTIREAETAAEPDVTLPDFAGLSREELLTLVGPDVPAEERNRLFAAVLDAVVVRKARYRGEPWSEARIAAVVPVSAAPRVMGDGVTR